MPVPLEVRETPPTADVVGKLVWVSTQFLGWGALVYAATHAESPSVTSGAGAAALTIPSSLSWSALAPVPLYLTFSLARAVSQCFWGLFLQPYSVPTSFYASISLFNTVFDGIGLYALMYHPNRSSATLDTQDAVWAALFAAGILLERIPELQRLAWKADPSNRGKPHTGGLFHYLVHANYTGYTLWRVALYGFTRQPLLQLINAFVVSQFREEVHAQHLRNSKKYGKEYEEYFQRTYKLLPFVY